MWTKLNVLIEIAEKAKTKEAKDSILSPLI